MVWLGKHPWLAFWSTTGWYGWVLVLLSNNCFSTPSLKCAAKASNVSIDLWNPNLLHLAWVCLIQISSTQTCIKSSFIQAFSYILTTKSVGMFRLRIVRCFSLKMIIGGSIFPSAMADKTTARCFFSLPEERTVHSLSPFFAMHFDDTMSKNAGVSSMCPTSESGYLPFSWIWQHPCKTLLKPLPIALAVFG